MIGVGIIGAGSFGAVHARAIRAVPGLDLVAACRGDAPALKAFTQEHGGTGYTDWRALLDDRRVDAVVIAAPHHLHAEMAIGAAEAGKHILLEKPMAPSVAECDAIIAAAAGAGVTLMVGHMMQFSAPCLAARDWVQSGRIGRPVAGTSWMIKLWMEANRRPWHLSGAGGGMLLTAGIHALDRLVWLMDDTVASVGAMIATRFHEQAADDAAFLSLRFRHGGLGQVQSVGYRDGAVTFAMDLVCETGTLALDMERGVAVGRGGSLTPIPGSSEPDWMQQSVTREWAALRDALVAGRPAPVSGQYGRAMIAIVEAARRADATRREEAIDANP
jgi:phthalate 4,5-cis-dihydrodiol dehydrogenase